MATIPCKPTYNEREVSKGTKLLMAREDTPSTYVRMGGVVSIDGPSGTRENIDADELDPQPDTIPMGGCEEQYFYKKQYPGEKTYSPMSVTLNMKWTQYKILLDAWQRDELCWFKILLRSGNFHYFQSFITDLGQQYETNKFVQVTIAVQPIAGINTTDATTTTSTTTPA